MAKRLRKQNQRRVTLPPMPDSITRASTADYGTGFQAEMLVLEAATEIDPETGNETSNPNGVKRMRRRSVLDALFQKGAITKRQFAAGEALQNAHEATMASAPCIRDVFVDRTVQAADGVAYRVEHITRKRLVAAAVPQWAVFVVTEIVINNRFPTSLPGGRNQRTRANYVMRLQKGLDRLADWLDAERRG